MVWFRTFKILLVPFWLEAKVPNVDRAEHLGDNEITERDSVSRKGCKH